MRLLIAPTLLAVAGFFAAASPSPHRQHRHHHREKRTQDHVIVVNQYKINGVPVALSEVCTGLKAGTLKLDDGSKTLEACNNPDTPTNETDKLNKKPPVVVPVEKTEKPDANNTTPDPKQEEPKQEEPKNEEPKKEDSNPPMSPPPSSYSYDYSSDNTHGSQGVDRDFPDGQIDCCNFPSDYGPIEIEWMRIGGWSGIQYPKYEGGFVKDMDTAIPGGSNCTIGALCSYACPAGYQKSQWPSIQGSTGQSVGGLRCNEHGKLTLTNPSLSKKLCVRGTGATKVQNKLKKNAAICRTDYPGQYLTPSSSILPLTLITGTESQTVPLDTLPGTTSPLTCPDSKTYYTHQGDPTTAQYYVNNQGVAKINACIWNKDGSHQGNWAPTYFGVGRDIYGKTWLSIASTAQNDPTDYQPLDYIVEIIGDQLSGKCRLSHGKYCSGDNYEICNDKGCTVCISGLRECKFLTSLPQVELLEGEGTYVLTDS